MAGEKLIKREIFGPSSKAWATESMKRLFFLLTVSMTVAACSPKHMFSSSLESAIANGAAVYTSDGDSDLVREALPFALKTYEGLLHSSPDHRQLLLAAASGFATYAFLLQLEADRIDPFDLGKSRRLRQRASRLYLRSRDFALRGLELKHAGFMERLNHNQKVDLSEVSAEEVPFLYWAGASWAGALNTARTDSDLIAALPVAAAFVRRVLKLDPAYQSGRAHEFFISYEAAQPDGGVERARMHYKLALELSGGQLATAHIAMAEAVAVREQNLSEFRRLLAAALAVDPDDVPEFRLLNSIALKRAGWLERRIPELFLEVD